MPRKPNATSPKANPAGDVISGPRLGVDVATYAAMPIRVTMLSPSQYALKLPATKPDRMFSEAPPSRDEDTTSLTWPESTDVKILTNSGMIAPASVPHVMTVDSFHQSVPSPSPGMSRDDTR